MKTCTACRKNKPVTAFHKNNAESDGCRKECKVCRIQRARSKFGRVRRIYRMQKRNSKQRGHPMPNYTVEDLIEWCVKQPKFHQLHSVWEGVNYNKKLTPTCDRIDDYKPYTLDNLQLMTWWDNKVKGEADRKKGKSVTAQMKTVVQFTLEGVYMAEYPSVSIASRAVGGSPSNVSKCCAGDRKTTMGFTWRYKNELRRNYKKSN